MGRVERLVVFWIVLVVVNETVKLMKPPMKCSCRLVVRGKHTESLSKSHLMHRVLHPLPSCFVHSDVSLRSVVLHGRPWTAGRKTGSDLVLPSDSRFSSTHFEITCATAGCLSITDTSKNGTFVNGIRLKPGVPSPLEHADIVTLVVPSVAAAARDPSLADRCVAFEVQLDAGQSSGSCSCAASAVF